jgi:predicted HicB family RNase H-like nuclease
VKKTPNPLAYTEQIRVRVPVPLQADIEEAARLDGRTVSNWVRRVLVEALNERRHR